MTTDVPKVLVPSLQGAIYNGVTSKIGPEPPILLLHGVQDAESLASVV